MKTFRIPKKRIIEYSGIMETLQVDISFIFALFLDFNFHMFMKLLVNRFLRVL